MDENRFFRFVWRFNAIVLMFAGVLAIGVLFFAGHKIIKEVTRERVTTNIVNVAESESVDEEWLLGALHKLAGTQFIMLPLFSNQGYAQSYYSKSTQSIRNYLFIDTITNERHWLFDTNNYLVSQTEYLSDKEFADDRITMAVLYIIVEKDTNGDKRLTERDEKTLAVSLPSGKSYKTIIEGADKFVGHKVLDEEHMIFIYQKQGIAYSANLSLSTFTISNVEELPKVKSP